MEYSDDKVMTRKEYIKSKSKHKIGIRIIKYTLLLVLIALLSMYLFKQLNVYNNVTKIANKVVEETALARTMIMYYVGEGYSKDSLPEVFLYKSFDESRSKIKGTEGFININLVDGILYGMCEQKLYALNLESNQKVQLTNIPIKSYVINNGKLYCYVESKKTNETGIYIYDNGNKELKLLINIVANQFLVDDSYIFIVSKGKTEKSLIRYNLNGSGRTVMSDKDIISYISQDKSYVYYVADNNLYRIKKNGKDKNIVIEDKVYVHDNVKNNTTMLNAYLIRDDIVYYIINGNEKNLCSYNVKTKQKQVLSKKNVESMQVVDNIIYYKLNEGIGIYKINLESGKSEQVTGIRGNEYICIN